jgi:hypothetical protein
MVQKTELKIVEFFSQQVYEVARACYSCQVKSESTEIIFMFKTERITP